MTKSPIPKLALGRKPLSWGSRQTDVTRYTAELTPFGVRVLLARPAPGSCAGNSSLIVPRKRT
jgi:hypothetical protein